MIRDLLAKAEHPAAPDKADLYNVEAAELMARHGVSTAMLASSGGANQDVMSRRMVSDSYSSW
jgi:hypothetical protein